MPSLRNLQDRHAGKMTASSPRARERWITGSWTATVIKEGPSPLLVETPQAQPSMKPSVSDAMRKKYLATKSMMKRQSKFRAHHAAAALRRAADVAGDGRRGAADG